MTDKTDFGFQVFAAKPKPLTQGKSHEFLARSDILNGSALSELFALARRSARETDILLDQVTADLVADALERNVQVRLLSCEEFLIGQAKGAADFAVYLQIPAARVDCRVDEILRHDIEFVVRCNLVSEKLGDRLVPRA